MLTLDIKTVFLIVGTSASHLKAYKDTVSLKFENSTRMSLLKFGPEDKIVHFIFLLLPPLLPSFLPFSILQQYIVFISLVIASASFVPEDELFHVCLVQYCFLTA